MIEVVAPGELREQAPEDPERALTPDVHVPVPDRLSRLGVRAHEPERAAPQHDAGVQQEDELAGGRRHAGAASLVSAPVRLADDAQGDPVGDGGPSDLRASVGRAVVDDDELGLEPALVDRGEQRGDRRRKARRFVPHRDDDAERRGGHGDLEP